MRHITLTKQEAGSAHLALFALLVLVGVAGIGYFVWKTDHKTPVAETTQASTTATTTVTSVMGNPTTYTPPTLTATSSDNQTLNSDMQSIDSSISQDGQHVQATNQSFSDNQINITN